MRTQGYRVRLEAGDAEWSQAVRRLQAWWERRRDHGQVRRTPAPEGEAVRRGARRSTLA